MSNSNPLVSVGLPTYNRGRQLRRAIESVLAQDYPNLELVISDNGSTDETEAVCTEFSRKDSRVRYIRQPVNRGMAFNFRTVLEEARGDYFMWLGDDDWLGTNLLSSCAQVLVEEPEHTIVGGLSKHCGSDGTVHHDGELMDLQQADGRARMLDYLERVRHNDICYGLMRRELLLRYPMRIVPAGDWLLIASYAFLGKVRMLSHAHVYRTDKGTSATIPDIVRVMGLHPILGKNFNLFYLRIATLAFDDILRVSPVYKSLGMSERLSLAYAAYRIIKRRWVHFAPLSVTARLGVSRVRSKIIIRTRLKRAFKGGKRKLDMILNRQ